MFQGKARKRLCKGFLPLGCCCGHGQTGQDAQAWPHVPLHTHSTRSLVLYELHLRGAGELAELSGWEGCLGIWGCGRL